MTSFYVTVSFPKSQELETREHFSCRNVLHSTEVTSLPEDSLGTSPARAGVGSPAPPWGPHRPGAQDGREHPEVTVCEQHPPTMAIGFRVSVRISEHAVTPKFKRHQSKTLDFQRSLWTSEATRLGGEFISQCVQDSGLVAGPVSVPFTAGRTLPWPRATGGVGPICAPSVCFSRDAGRARCGPSATVSLLCQ